jgi:hypothetical protein
VTAEDAGGRGEVKLDIPGQRGVFIDRQGLRRVQDLPARLVPVAAHEIGAVVELDLEGAVGAGLGPLELIVRQEFERAAGDGIAFAVERVAAEPAVGEGEIQNRFLPAD